MLTLLDQKSLTQASYINIIQFKKPPMQNFLFFLLYFIFSTHTHSSEATNQIPIKLKPFIQKIEKEKQNLQGGAIAIVYNGNIIYQTTFGHQKGKTGQITTKTLFPLASVSKSVAATALALMVDNGQLNLNKEYQLSPIKSPIQLKHILSHTVGVSFSGNTQIENGMNRPQLLQELKTFKVTAQPGNSYFYSNTIYSLVEEILNKQNCTFNSTIENLCETLKTDQIQVLPLNKNVELAYPHRQNTTKGKKPNVDHFTSLPFPPYYPKVVPAAAGVFASLEGMIELIHLLSGQRPDLISQSTLDIFYTPIIKQEDYKKWQINIPFKLSQVESYYGLGFRIFRSKEQPDLDFVYHGGSIAGISTFMGFIPSQKVGIIILLNQNSKFATQKGFEFWSTFLT